MPWRKKSKERQKETRNCEIAEEILKFIRMSLEMANATAQDIQINNLFQPSLTTDEMWMKGCPWLQKLRRLRGFLAFEDKAFKSKIFWPRRKHYRHPESISHPISTMPDAQLQS